MTTTDLTQFAVKSVEEIRSGFLSTYSNELQRRGISNPDVSLGTEIYTRAQAIAVQIAYCSANLPIMADALMADSAQGADLERIAATYGLALKAAGPSSGGIVFANNGASLSLVVIGAPLIDSTGQLYKVAVGGTYANGDRIPVVSVSTGTSTNLAAGVTLRWQTPPPFAANGAPVASGGLTGGTDAETIEGLRSRLLDRLRNPPNGANAAQLAIWAEDASTAVVKAFVYPCNNGPSTVMICVCGAPTLTNKSRQVDGLILATVIAPDVASKIPEFVDVTYVTSTDIPVDVSIGLALPTSASFGGPGGGWLDAAPWPVKTSQGFADVTAVTNATTFAINADVAPTAGVSRICWLSPFDWRLYFATVLSFSGTGPWTVTVDQPLVGIATGQWICPQAKQSATYFNTLLSAFAGMGPGEITSAAGLLPTALRRPKVSTSAYPNAPGPPMLRLIEDSGTEVLDTSFLYRSATVCPLPSIPVTSPNIFIARKCGLYPAS